MSKFLMIFSIVVLMIFSLSVSAQRFKPGLVIGGVSSDLVGVDPYDDDFSKAGFTAGALLNTKFSEKNSFQFEILFTDRGTLQKPDSLNNYTLYKLSLDYVDVPLMFKHNFIFNVGKKRVDRFSFEIGPSYSRLVRVSQTGTYGGFYDNNFNSNDFALNVGLGCRIMHNLSLNVRYSNSIIPIVPHPTYINSYFWYSFNKGDNVWFSFSLRYVFSNEKDKVGEKTSD